ncbi:MAG: hypothetical protein MJZ31_00615 [Bacteroidales bacterium]|nr:hypothetical protein [Bacteroidales bacterium]
MPFSVVFMVLLAHFFSTLRPNHTRLLSLFKHLLVSACPSKRTVAAHCLTNSPRLVLPVVTLALSTSNPLSFKTPPLSRNIHSHKPISPIASLDKKMDDHHKLYSPEHNSSSRHRCAYDERMTIV